MDTGEMILRKKKRWLIFFWAAALIVLMLAFSAMMSARFSASPEGVFYDRNLDGGEGYWVLENGRIYIRDGSTNLITNYFKLGDTWLYGSSPTNRQIVLEPSLFGLKMVDTVDHKNDVFIPRRGFAWIFELVRGK